MRCWTIAVKSCRSLPPGRSESPCPLRTPSHLRSLAARGPLLDQWREAGKKKDRVMGRQQRQVRETRNSYENTSQNRCTHQHTNQINPPNALLASLSLFLSLSPPTYLFLCLSDYLYISICLSESKDTIHARTRTRCQRDKKKQTNDYLVVRLRGQCKSDESVAAMASRDCTT